MPILRISAVLQSLKSRCLPQVPATHLPVIGPALQISAIGMSGRQYRKMTSPEAFKGFMDTVGRFGFGRVDFCLHYCPNTETHQPIWAAAEDVFNRVSVFIFRELFHHQKELELGWQQLVTDYDSDFWQKLRGTETVLTRDVGLGRFIIARRFSEKETAKLREVATAIEDAVAELLSSSRRIPRIYLVRSGTSFSRILEVAGRPEYFYGFLDRKVIESEGLNAAFSKCLAVCAGRE